MQKHARILMGTLAGISLLGSPAMAEDIQFKSSMHPTKEDLGIDRIFKLIDDVNLKQSDVKNGQSFFNFTELKNQVYTSRTAQPVNGAKPLPPSPLRKAI